jgi:modulator of FtsH protease
MGAAYNPAYWFTFFSAEVSASAALTGLIFVAVSINLSRILEMHSLVSRSAKALVALTGILLASTLCMASGQPVAALGCELFFLGALVWISTTLLQHSASHKNPYIKASQRFGQVLLTQFSAVPLIAAGVSLLLRIGGGLYWLVAAAVFSFIAALFDAWVLLIEIQR